MGIETRRVANVTATADKGKTEAHIGIGFQVWLRHGKITIHGITSLDLVQTNGIIDSHCQFGDC